MDFNERNTVKVEFEIMQKLVRDSERLEALRDFARKNEYISKTDLHTLLGLEEGER